MGIYNKVMLYFWLVMAVLIFVGVTIMGIYEGFDRWVFSYLFGGISLLMFFVRRYMMKRMVKHMAYLEELKKSQNK
ncbi:MAG: hypothetical protein E6Q37_09040 [Crocinitomicaceae bacterium]|nr:MAG: hypothetical protein E6Q37_09040 [Crocinitomicaceae bacterium]